jgi:DNA-binding winged helix-turn-helix (wHTH) protein
MGTVTANRPSEVAKHERPGAGVHLALEPWTGTAIIDGDRIELPPKEFGVLAYLATRLGNATTHQEIVDAVFPETPWMTGQELAWKVWRLRQKIGDDEREIRILSNRRGFGYFIDLAPGDIEVLDIKPSSSGGVEVADEETIEVPVPLTPISESDIGAAPPAEHSAPMLPRKLVAAASLILLGLFAAAAMLSLRSPTSGQAVMDSVADAPPHSDAHDDPSPREAQRQVKGKQIRRSQWQRRSSVATTASTTMVAAPVQEANEPRGSKRPDPAPAPAALSPPTRYLYDLINGESGDHFVTTDPSVVSEYQARGYRSRSLARVYTEKVTGTRQISTNAGVAYIFDSAHPKTEPEISTLPLWLVSDGAGDFFYATSKVTDQGWTSSLVGYVRSP